MACHNAMPSLPTITCPRVRVVQSGLFFPVGVRCMGRVGGSTVLRHPSLTQCHGRRRHKRLWLTLRRRPRGLIDALGLIAYLENCHLRWVSLGTRDCVSSLEGKGKVVYCMCLPSKPPPAGETTSRDGSSLGHPFVPPIPLTSFGGAYGQLRTRRASPTPHTRKKAAATSPPTPLPLRAHQPSARPGQRAEAATCLPSSDDESTRWPISPTPTSPAYLHTTSGTRPTSTHTTHTPHTTPHHIVDACAP